MIKWWLKTKTKLKTLRLKSNEKVTLFVVMKGELRTNEELDAIWHSLNSATPENVQVVVFSEDADIYAVIQEANENGD